MRRTPPIGSLTDDVWRCDTGPFSSPCVAADFQLVAARLQLPTALIGCQAIFERVKLSFNSKSTIAGWTPGRARDSANAVGECKGVLLRRGGSGVDGDSGGGGDCACAMLRSFDT